MIVFGVLQRKYTKFYSILAIIYISVTIGLNTQSPDYASYRHIYTISSDLNAYTNTEIGYTFINYMFNLLGFSYEQFRLLWGIIIAFLYVSAAHRLSNCSNYVLGLYFIYPFIGNISGLRFTMTSAIVCFCIPYLLEGKKGYIKYTIGILLASLIHMTALFYLIFWFALKEYKLSQHLKIGLGILFVSVTIKSEIIVKFAQKFAGEHLLHKITKWLSLQGKEGAHVGIMRFIVQSTIVILLFFLVNEIAKGVSRSICYKKINNGDESVKKELWQKQRSITLYRNISCCMLLIIPTFIFSTEFQRLQVGILPVYYAVYSEYRQENIMSDKRNKKIYMVLCYLSVFMYLVFFMVTNRGNVDYIGMLTNNFIFRAGPPK